jgi:hypothetical protein
MKALENDNVDIFLDYCGTIEKRRSCSFEMRVEYLNIIYQRSLYPELIEETRDIARYETPIESPKYKEFLELGAKIHETAWYNHYKDENFSDELLVSYAWTCLAYYSALVLLDDTTDDEIEHYLEKMIQNNVTFGYNFQGLKQTLSKLFYSGYYPALEKLIDVILMEQNIFKNKNG